MTDEESFTQLGIDRPWLRWTSDRWRDHRDAALACIARNPSWSSTGGRVVALCEWHIGRLAK